MDRCLAMYWGAAVVLYKKMVWYKAVVAVVIQTRCLW